MDTIRLCAWGYAALLGFVILTGYVPAFIDADDMIFGLFRRTWYADGLHLVSALWAAAAAVGAVESSSGLCSRPSARRSRTRRSPPTWAASIQRSLSASRS